MHDERNSWIDADPETIRKEFGSDIANSWAKFKNRDMATVQKYLAVVDRLELVDRYTHKDRTVNVNHGYEPICEVCDKDIEKGTNMDRVLVKYETYWCRFEAHELCAIPKTRHNECKIDMSRTAGKVLLLLQELGLPYDLAWPITAAACWLL